MKTREFCTALSGITKFYKTSIGDQSSDLQSSCYISYNRDTDSVVNNIFPDIDRHKGIPCPVNSKTLSTVERKNIRTQKYRKFTEKDAKHTII